MADPSRDEGDLFSLTQIRHLMRVEFGRALRYGYPLSCLVISLDRSGHLRDLHGYEGHARLLDEVSRLLLGATRSCDYLGRLVDDRLMAILPHTGRDGAERAARRILAEARGLSGGGGAAGGPLSVSIGIACYERENTMFFDDLVDAAEGACEQAARAGGDRYAFREPGPGRDVAAAR